MQENALLINDKMSKRSWEKKKEFVTDPFKVFALLSKNWRHGKNVLMLSQQGQQIRHVGYAPGNKTWCKLHTFGIVHYIFEK